MIQKQFIRSAGYSRVKRNRIALISAYNDALFIGSMVLQSLQHVDQVVVVDNASTDGTAHIASVAGAQVLSIPKHVGKACAVSQGIGIGYIRGLEPTAVVMMDGDGQHDPNDIPKLLELIEIGSADIVTGSPLIHPIEHPRVGRHAGTTNQAPSVKISDSHSDFRAPWPPKGHGRQVLDGLLRLVGQMRPLLFFGASGLLILIAGLLMGASVVQMQLRSSEVAMEYLFVSVLLSIMGGVALSTGLILHSVRALLSE